MLTQLEMGLQGNNETNPPTTDRLIHIVDDEPMLLELAQAILCPLGYQVTGFRSGEAALRAFEAASRKPALLITDYAMGMEVMNGLDLVDACRKLVPGLKVLLLSGTVDESVYCNVEEKPNAFLGKPYLPRQLVAIVRELVGS